jgi:hypothetical protein
MMKTRLTGGRRGDRRDMTGTQSFSIGNQHNRQHLMVVQLQVKKEMGQVLWICFSVSRPDPLCLFEMVTNINTDHVSFHNDYCTNRCDSVQLWLKERF